MAIRAQGVELGSVPMVTIDICGLRRRAEDVSDGWIREQLHRRFEGGALAWVIVEIRADPINMNLATPTCPPRPGGYRRPTEREQRIFDLWDKCGMGKRDFGSANLLGFLSRLSNWL